MADYEALLADLTLANITVDGLRQTFDGKWCAKLALRYHIDGRVIEHICDGLTAYDALVNCWSLIEWSKANPPLVKRHAKGSIDELLSIVRATPAYEALSPADVKSLKL